MCVFPFHCQAHQFSPAHTLAHTNTHTPVLSEALPLSGGGGSRLALRTKRWGGILPPSSEAALKTSIGKLRTRPRSEGIKPAGPSRQVFDQVSGGRNSPVLLRSPKQTFIFSGGGKKKVGWGWKMLVNKLWGSWSSFFVLTLNLFCLVTFVEFTEEFL